MTTLLQELRVAARMLARRHGFALVAIILGITAVIADEAVLGLVAAVVGVAAAGVGALVDVRRMRAEDSLWEARAQARRLRRQLDSLQVELQDGSITVKARLATARLPKELIGPLSMALQPTEPIQAAGPLTVVGPRQAEWALRSFSIRGFPLPHDAVPQLVSKALGSPSRKTVPVRIPAG